MSFPSAYSGRPFTARLEHRHWVSKAGADGFQDFAAMTYVKGRNQREFRHHLANAENGHPLDVIWEAP
jgi:hypothetical protein